MCICLQSYVDSIRSVLFEKVQPKQELDAMALKITQIFNKRTKALEVMCRIGGYLLLLVLSMICLLM